MISAQSRLQSGARESRADSSWEQCILPTTCKISSICRGSRATHDSATQPANSRPRRFSRRAYPRLPCPHRKPQPETPRLYHRPCRLRSRSSAACRAGNPARQLPRPAPRHPDRTQRYSRHRRRPHHRRQRRNTKTAFPSKTPKSSAACAPPEPSSSANKTCTSSPTAAAR